MKVAEWMFFFHEYCSLEDLLIACQAFLSVLLDTVQAETWRPVFFWCSIQVLVLWPGSNYGCDVLLLPATPQSHSSSSLPHPHTLSHGGELAKKP